MTTTFLSAIYKTRPHESEKRKCDNFLQKLQKVSSHNINSLLNVKLEISSEIDKIRVILGRERLFLKKGRNRLQIRCNTCTEKHLWPPSVAKHLRIDQVVRYFSASTKSIAKKAAPDKPQSTRGFTKEWREVHDLADDPLHPNYNAKCAAL